MTYRRSGFLVKLSIFFLFVSGFDAHRRKRRSEVNSRPLFDSKGKSDEKRQKVKELLGKRKQMQFSHFTSAAKTNSDFSKLGIKVLWNRSRESEDSGKSPDKRPSDEGPLIISGVNLSRTRLDSHSGLGRSGDSVQENCVGTGLKVTSKTETRDETEDRTCISSSISISHAKENHKAGIEMSDNVTRNVDSSVSSLVCCDYADSSDASDDLT